MPGKVQLGVEPLRIESHASSYSVTDALQPGHRDARRMMRSGWRHPTLTAMSRFRVGVAIAGALQCPYVRRHSS